MASLIVVSVLVMLVVCTITVAWLAWLAWQLLSWLADRLMVAIHVLTRFER